MEASLEESEKVFKLLEKLELAKTGEELRLVQNEVDSYLKVIFWNR